MNDYIISGIQQIGIGVTDVHEAWKWYREVFGMDCRIFEDDAVARLMLPYTGGKPWTRHAVLAMNLQSGGGFEIWQYKGRKPLEPEEEIRLGDLGIIACKIKARSAEAALSSMREKGIEVPSQITFDPSGRKSYIMKDPWGNLFQITEADDWFMNEGKPTGGSYGAIIGVSNIEKARIVYSEILGYDKVIYDVTGTFPDIAGIPGSDTVSRRVLLGRSKPFEGPVSRIFGMSEIELVSTVKPGKKIYEGRYWGDIGFIQICYDIQGMDELKSHCESKGFPFTVNSKESHAGDSFDMGEAAGYFSYIEDPDGTLIEFVETHKIPVSKRLGWYIDLRKRNPRKSLPVWMLKSLKFSRVK